MPNSNPAFSGTDALVTIYRGGAAGAWEVKAMKRGYLMSKLMKEWADEGGVKMDAAPFLQHFKVPQLMQTVGSLFQTRTETEVVLQGGEFHGRTLVIPFIPMATFQIADAFARKQHSVSSSASSTVNPPTGNSAYVSLTFEIEKAREWTSNKLWRFTIHKSDLFDGNSKESEMLALGGTPIGNISLSEDRGISFTKSFGNGEHDALTV